MSISEYVLFIYSFDGQELIKSLFKKEKQEKFCIE